ncbi:MAG: cell division topological specificity factor MinE [Anaerolineaceae bacterium]|nr:cell division topological specificity factor MinE [Anaerolineaceae bacterium]
MSGFFERLLGRTNTKGSGTTAKERLQFILVHDRINLPPERLQAMKAEILEVISKYVSVDSEDVDIFLEQRDRNSLIKAEIPFTGVNEKDEARNRLAHPSSPNDEIVDDG